MYENVKYRRQMGDWWEDIVSGASKIIEPLAKAAPSIASAIAIAQGKYIPTAGGGLLPTAKGSITGMIGTGTGSSGLQQLADGTWVIVGPQGQITRVPAPAPGMNWTMPLLIGGGALLLIMTMQPRRGS